MPDQNYRYARQLALSGFGEAAQNRLSEARVMVVGLGGLGSPAASYLAAAGVGHLTINDFDSVHASNLHRQTLYDDRSIGTRKTMAAGERLRQINGLVEVEAIDRRLEPEPLGQQIAMASLVLDCTDNFATRQAINAACVAHRKPLVSGAAAGMDGQVAVFACDRRGPCYQCFLDGVGDELGDCEGGGVLGPVTGVIGSLMAVEAIKVLAELGKPLAGRVVIYDGLNGDFRTLKLRRNGACIECGD